MRLLNELSYVTLAYFFSENIGVEVPDLPYDNASAAKRMRARHHQPKFSHFPEKV